MRDGRWDRTTRIVESSRRSPSRVDRSDKTIGTSGASGANGNEMSGGGKERALDGEW